MPELPEVEHFRRILLPLVGGVTSSSNALPRSRRSDFRPVASWT